MSTSKKPLILTNPKDNHSKYIEYLSELEVVEMFKPLVYKISSSFIIKHKSFSYRYELEDLVQIGYIGLLKAYHNYAPDLEKPLEHQAIFLTYASIIITNSILMELRRDKKHKKHEVTSINIPVPGQKREDGVEFSDIVPDMHCKQDFEDVVPYQEYYKKLLKHAYKGLTNTELKVIDLYYFKSRKQYQISEELGLSQSYISRVMHKAHNKMYKKLYHLQKEVYDLWTMN